MDDLGRYVSGDNSLALIAQHLVRNNHGGIVVTGINTSKCLEDVVVAEGGTVVYTPIGSPLIARRMMELSAIMGGEENGGLIFSGHQHCRDGGMTAAKLLEMLASSNAPLSSLVDSLPTYFVKKTKLKCDDNAKKQMMEKFADYCLQKGFSVETMDGVKVIVDDRSWVLVRPSGTEPIMRIQTQSGTKDGAEGLAEEYMEILRSL